LQVSLPAFFFAEHEAVGLPVEAKGIGGETADVDATCHVVRSPVPSFCQFEGDGSVGAEPVAIGEEDEVGHTQVVAFADGGLVEDGQHVSAIGIASVGLPFALFGILDAVGPRAVGSLNADVSSVGIRQLEGGMDLAVGLVVVAPYHACAVSGHEAFLHLELLRLVVVVAQVESSKWDVVVGGVVKLHPIGLLAMVVDVDVVA